MRAGRANNLRRRKAPNKRQRKKKGNRKLFKSRPNRLFAIAEADQQVLAIQRMLPAHHANGISIG